MLRLTRGILGLCDSFVGQFDFQETTADRKDESRMFVELLGMVMTFSTFASIRGICILSRCSFKKDRRCARGLLSSFRAPENA